ncbi:hypothetical protein BACFIN_07206 [Bacteroides finegoldii DSM 17565]|nr:hypothetical protein BACFIN_07206 [Bacteroides finegoldii DSM 17565]
MSSIKLFKVIDFIYAKIEIFSLTASILRLIFAVQKKNKTSINH